MRKSKLTVHNRNRELAFVPPEAFPSRFSRHARPKNPEAGAKAAVRRKGRRRLILFSIYNPDPHIIMKDGILFFSGRETFS
jgi:hypothetical protein